MTKVIHISKEIAYSMLLKDINHILTDMKLPVTGEGKYKKYTGKYGHIKIKIYHIDEGYSGSICKWNVTEETIPSAYQKNVEKVISFFITYVAGLTGEDKFFTFEVIGGSTHPVDGRAGDYEIATLFAIINAFDNELCKP